VRTRRSVSTNFYQRTLYSSSFTLKTAFNGTMGLLAHLQFQETRTELVIVVWDYYCEP
jgi:hypothetical protein